MTNGVPLLNMLQHVFVWGALRWWE